jgi:hypothetical protein
MRGTIVWILAACATLALASLSAAVFVTHSIDQTLREFGGSTPAAFAEISAANADAAPPDDTRPPPEDPVTFVASLIETLTAARAVDVFPTDAVDEDEFFVRCLREDAVDLTDPQRDEIRSLLARTFLSILWRDAPRIRATSAELLRTSSSPDLVVRVRGALSHEREQSSAFDFHLRRSVGGSFRVTDLVTEGSSAAHNIGEQIHKRLVRGPDGYADVIVRLQRKFERPR